MVVRMYNDAVANIAIQMRGKRLWVYPLCFTCIPFLGKITIEHFEGGKVPVFKYAIAFGITFLAAYALLCACCVLGSRKLGKTN
jgi:hypothetical protein